MYACTAYMHCTDTWANTCTNNGMTESPRLFPQQTRAPARTVMSWGSSGSYYLQINSSYYVGGGVTEE